MQPPETTTLADTGEQLNRAADDWKRGIYATTIAAGIIEAMQRPDPDTGRNMGRYVAIAALPTLDRVLGIFMAEFNMSTQALTITEREFPEPVDPEELPEPFRTLATQRGSGFRLLCIPTPKGDR